MKNRILTEDELQDKMCDLCEKNIEYISRNTCEGNKCHIAKSYLEDYLNELKEEENKVDNLLLFGTAKLFSDQSTRVIGSSKNSKESHHFNQAVKYVDKFIKVIEEGLKEEADQKSIDILMTDMNKGLNNFRSELLNKPINEESDSIAFGKWLRQNAYVRECEGEEFWEYPTDKFGKILTLTTEEIYSYFKKS